MDNESEVVVETIEYDSPEEHLLTMNTEQGTMGTSTTRSSQSMATANKTKAIKICGFVFLISILLVMVIVALVYVESVRTNTGDKPMPSKRINCSNNTFPNYTFPNCTFPNNTFQRQDLYVSIANTEGVMIDLNVSFWCRLPKANASRISSSYGENYANSVSRAVVRHTAVLFSVSQYLGNRTGVRHHIAESLSHALSEIGNDCPSYMVRLEIGFTTTLLNVHLMAAVTLENNLQKEYQHQADEIRAETNRSVEEFLAQADNITRMAEAYKTAEVEAARVKYNESIAEARYNSSKKTMDALGIVNSTDIAMFLTLMGILDNTTYIIP
eukprot:1161658_1